MPRGHKITSKVVEAVHEALIDGDCWVVFHARYHVMDVEDMQFFRSENEAVFACDLRTNSNDLYAMEHIDSVEDFINKLGKTVEVPDLISQEVWEKAKKAFECHENWVAYNNTLLFVHTDDIQFFSNKDDANDFVFDNLNEAENFKVVRIDSLAQFQELVESVVPGLKYVPVSNEKEALLMDDGPGYFPKQILNERKTIMMKQMSPELFEKNKEALQNKLKFMGFDEGLFKQLEAKMKEGNPEFSLPASTTFGNDKMEAVINFKYAEKEEKGQFFCNNYIATLKGETDQSVMVWVRNKGQNITFRESCNLANERSVCKTFTPNDGAAYKAWVDPNPNDLDEKTGYPKLKHFGYDFEVKEAIGRLPFKELSDPEALKKLIGSIEKGNVPYATLVSNDREQRVYLEANPKSRTLNMYDSDGNKLNFPLEKVAQKYGQAPVDAKRQEAVLNESAPAYGKGQGKDAKNLLSKRGQSNGLLKKNTKGKRTGGQRIK